MMPGEKIFLFFFSNCSYVCLSKRITEYWPEFGQNGKEKTTIADLMRHEVKKHQNFENLMRDEVKKIKSLKSDSQAGLPNAGPMAAEDCLAANIRQNKVPIYENLLST